MSYPHPREAWLLGGSERCHDIPTPPGQTLRLILIGAPGIGKGTQAALLSSRFGACALSTGDIFRHAGRPGITAAPGSPLHQALDCMHRGELVSDDIVLGLIFDRITCLRCDRGFLLDGFPRTTVQAEALDHLMFHHHLKLDAVINYELPARELAARISGRRTCPKCKAVYHLEASPPKHKGLCNHCHTPLVVRTDDQPEASRLRMRNYEKHIAPLMDYYRTKAMLLTVSAAGTPVDVFRRTVESLQPVLA